MGTDFIKKVLEDYASEKSKYKKFLKVKSNPFLMHYRLNILMQLPVISLKEVSGKMFLLKNPIYLRDLNKDYLGWLYTAMTRAKNILISLGFQMMILNRIQ